MKISQNKNKNSKLITIIWNLVILLLLCIDFNFTCCILYSLLLENIQHLLTFICINFILWIIVILATSPIHELGHVMMILIFNHKLEVTWCFSHTECNWEKLNDKALRVVAISGALFAILTASIISLAFHFLGFKTICTAIIVSSNLQLINLLSIKYKNKLLDGYALFYPSEFREFSKQNSTNKKWVIYLFNKPK